MLIWTPVTEFISDINPHEFHAEEEKNIRTARIDSPRDKNKFSLV